MTDIGLSQEQIDAMLGGGSGGEAVPAAGFSTADAGIFGDFEREVLGNLPNVINAMTGFEYALGSLEVSQTNPDELPDLIGNDLIFSFPIDVGGTMSHFLVFDQAYAKKIAAALTGGEVTEDLTLNEMELSAITEVVSQANGSYLTSLSAALKTTAKGEAVEQIDAKTLAERTDARALVSTISLDQPEGESATVRHIVSGGLAEKILNKLRPTPEAPAIPKPEPAKASPAPEQPQVASSGNVVSGSTEFSAAQFSDLPEVSIDADPRNLEILLDVPLTITVELGKTLMPIRQILEYAQGSLITLDKLAGEPIDLLVNGKYFAKGEVVVIDENFGVRITSILSPAERLSQLS